MLQVYKKNIYKSFSISFLKVSLVFLTIIIIMNLFEEINFLKQVDGNTVFLSLFLTLLNTPSVLLEIFPFIFLISGMYFFIEIIDREEISIYKLYGLTNLKIITSLSLMTFLIGTFILIFFYHISSNLKFVYLEMKNQYSLDDKYLAVITGNGLWIKDEVDNQINYINADKIDDNKLINLSISQFDKEFNLKKIIISKEADVEKNIWILKQSTENVENNSVNHEQLKFKSNFNMQKILTIFNNYSSLDFFKLQELKKDYEFLGYNTNSLEAYKHKLFSYPVYFVLMVCVASILMLNIQFNKPKIYFITLGILLSVIIYYIDYFFSTIVNTRGFPYLLSVWGPKLILFLIISIPLIKINEK
jgi:lipopolysaccharide export system permease protein